MTYEEALELFGLSRIPSEAVLKILRNDAVKAAVEQKDEERQKAINSAFAVLIGKEDAEIADGQGEKRTGPSGLVKAVCSEHKDKAFVLEWQKMPAEAQDNTDKVMMSNPQRLEWDSKIDGYVRIDSVGKRFNYDDKEYSKADGSPFDAKTRSWTSGFEAEIKFSSHAPCPSCHAPHFQWCQYCDTIFCHRGRDDYPDQSYTCPECDGGYSWGGNSGESIKTVFDGKHLRSLTAEERKSIANTKLLKK
ncbi:MAG: hypothetical protein JKY95_19195 [Planctomycetaceae bacterium]|nr:hypothetical protein [Planctomycetaceae bacterium]